jgi:hypothetical protein
MAGLPDMQELSLLRAESAKQITATNLVRGRWEKDAPLFLGASEVQNGLLLVLGFDAWHFSGGPILEETNDA